MSEVITEANLFVGGTWRPARGGSIEVECPRDGTIIGTAGIASAQDVGDAVGAAADALPGWAARPKTERIALVEALLGELRTRAERLAELVALEQGSPAVLARKLHVDIPIAATEAYIEAARQLDEREAAGRSTIRREPIGVVAAITPWNVPLHQAVIKIVPALLAGNTVVLKPSELTPLAAAELARAVEAAGFPGGTFNLVIGLGSEAGQALVADPRVGHISFTGSTATGERVAAAAARGIRGVTLELGGKSPSVVLGTCGDERFAAAVKVTVADCFLNGGQTCTALSRLIVPAGRIAEAEDLARAAAAKHVPGERLGPLISAEHLRRVRALLDGAPALAIDAELPARGHYMTPVVLSPVAPDSPLAQEEIFGPVLSIIPVADDDEAIAVANATRYGLTATVWSDDDAAAESAAGRIRAGQVIINGAPFDVAAPFGGMKQSGLGRELGAHGLADMYELKAIVK